MVSARVGTVVGFMVRCGWWWTWRVSKKSGNLSGRFPWNRENGSAGFQPAGNGILPWSGFSERRWRDAIGSWRQRWVTTREAKWRHRGRASRKARRRHCRRRFDKRAPKRAARCWPVGVGHGVRLDWGSEMRRPQGYEDCQDDDRHRAHERLAPQPNTAGARGFLRQAGAQCRHAGWRSATPRRTAEASGTRAASRWSASRIASCSRSLPWPSLGVAGSRVHRRFCGLMPGAAKTVHFFFHAPQFRERVVQAAFDCAGRDAERRGDLRLGCFRVKSGGGRLRDAAFKHGSAASMARRSSASATGASSAAPGARFETGRSGLLLERGRAAGAAAPASRGCAGAGAEGG